MARLSVFSAPFLLGFETFEERVDRLAKSAEGYPPYNIERLKEDDGSEKFVISIAVAGFGPEDLEVIAEDNQIVVRGRQTDEQGRQFLHRGIATRQFQRSFLLADGMTVESADLSDGMLMIAVDKPHIEKVSRRIEIRAE
jgi:HSP20 family molecular chaperone IbpA